ncbi:MAG: DUF4124 domain-containing protein [Xanthomonadales bacterium]|nr:DUF4124 domain-containing protein [Gammaproteobacteria bacterium]NNE06915.1 DUF4124 domain-containing protein [Xanthomonadales bacterium]NNL94567.1 DUF4124 domain-containing protein [Xanthomonadales bacterium]
MKDHAIRVFIFALVLLCMPAIAEVYKVVDENGNVTYTDQPPDSDSVPVELPGLSIISPQQAPVGRRTAEQASEEGEPEVTSIRDLRRSYRDFAIVSPQQDESLWGTDNTATIAWDTQYQLQAGMSVIVYLDGKAQPATNSPVSVFTELDRGEHKVRAELFDNKNRKVATSPTVTFYIKQQSINFPANRNNPNNPSNSGGNPGGN